MTYNLPLPTILNLITDGLTELHAANSATPYSHLRYEAADKVIFAGLLILTGDTEMAQSIRERLYDWSGENVGTWFIAEWMKECGWEAQNAAEFDTSTCNLS